MIFGKTNDERWDKEQKEIQKRINGIRRFALIPKELANGQWVWLQPYFSYYAGEEDNGIYQLLSFSTDVMIPMEKNYLERNQKYIRCKSVNKIRR